MKSLHDLHILMDTNIKLIVFDWDGTLADSMGHILNSFRAAAIAMNLKPVSDEKIKPLVGLGLRTVIEALYPLIDSNELTSFSMHYQQAYLKQPKCVLFSGVRNLLTHFKQQGVLMAVATGKGRQGLNKAMEDTCVTDNFLLTRTVNECPFKPDPTMLHEILEVAQLDVTQAIMVGDAVCDMQMATSIGMSAIGVKTGGGTEDELYQAGSSYVIESVLDLKNQ